MGKKKTVYIESSTISYLTAKPTDDPIRKAKQIQTQKWWKLSDLFDLYISDTVLEEIGRGDKEAANLRMNAVEKYTVLALNEQIENFAQVLIQTGAIPAIAKADAYHVAYATIYNMDFLLTWNQKHIATNARRGFIEAVIQREGWRIPQLLTPEQHLLDMELENGNRY